MDVKTDSTGTRITNITPEDRVNIGLMVAVARLKFAVRFGGRTDSAPLDYVRMIARSEGHTGTLRTMKQALKWVESR